MTTEEKVALTGLCRIEIKRWKAASESNPNMRYMVNLMEIALGALEAESRWVAHGGSCRPAGLGKDDFIYLKTRGRELKLPYPAGMVNWKHDGSDFDVIAWCNAYAAPTP